VNIKIQKNRDVPIRDQLFAQIAFLIATGKLKPEEILPSVRALALQLRIHRNTVSQAYQALVESNFLVRRRGSRMAVRIPEQRAFTQQPDLDALIDQTVRTAHQRGFTTQQLAERVRERLSAESPNHILALSPDAGMRRLLEAELRAAFVVRSCTPDELLRSPSLAARALVVSPAAFLPVVLQVLPKGQPVLSIKYSSAEKHLGMVRDARRPSLIMVISVSERFLEIARGLLKSAMGPQHSLIEHLVEEGKTIAAGKADILFCDVMARERLPVPARRKAVVYRLLSPQCLVQIGSMMGPGDPEQAAPRREFD
jgi:DNA-binding transcriptional regulator YhcF (GntR family)